MLVVASHVAPFTGAWIEIQAREAVQNPPEGSLPSRERGLKSDLTIDDGKSKNVAPFTGAWIEIRKGCPRQAAPQVAPFTGAWIEIRPSACRCQPPEVAPFTGAWIEMRP